MLSLLNWVNCLLTTPHTHLVSKVFLYHSVSFSHHVQTAWKSPDFHIWHYTGVISQSYQPQSSSISEVNAVLFTRLNNCNSLLIGQSIIDYLHLANTTVKILQNRHITVILYSLHRLQRIQFNICLVVHEVLFLNQPTYCAASGIPVIVNRHVLHAMNGPCSGCSCASHRSIGPVL